MLSGRYGDVMFAVTEVPAMVHVTADTAEPTESTPETATVERGSDVYSTLKLDVTVKSIKLELFSGDSDLVRYQGSVFNHKHVSVSVRLVCSG